jgi:hypothetical protein
LALVAAGLLTGLSILRHAGWEPRCAPARGAGQRWF